MSSADLERSAMLSGVDLERMWDELDPSRALGFDTEDWLAVEL